MDFERVRRTWLIIEAIISVLIMLGAYEVILAQERDTTRPAESREIQSPETDAKEPIRGYPARMRRIGTPMDVEWNLNNSFPKSGSLLELILDCSDSSLEKYGE